MNSVNSGNSPILRIAILGAGGIAAKMHLPELAEQTHRAKISVLAGRNPKRLQTLADECGARWSQDFDSVISDPEIDAIIIATPHPQHVYWGEAALRAGKHLFMQKPLCTDMGEADSFVVSVDQAASNGQVTLCLPHYPDAVHEMRRQIDEGVIGRVSGANARTSHAGPEVYYREVAEIFGESLDEENLWFFDKEKAGVGALFDMGAYAVAHIVALLGSVKRVSAFLTTLDKPTELEDSAALLLHMGNGAVAVAETGWCDGARTWQVRVNGTRGKYEFSGTTTPTHFFPEDYQSDHAQILNRPVSPRVPVGDSHNHWLDCIASGEQPPLSHARAARHVTEVLLAGLESARTGQIVDILSKAD